MDIEEDDEVERELDIVYSGQFSNETKLFQFPLIPQSSMNIQNINSLNVNKDKSSMKIEMNIDQKYLDKNNYNAVPTQTLKGEKIENNSNLCLGMIKNNKLFLTPISQIFQFRHDFSNVNKEKVIQTKNKKDKQEIKNLDLKKEEKEDTNFTSIPLYQPNSINSKIILEKMAETEGEIQQANYMTKNEYLDLLFKYVITPDTGGEPNDDFLYLSKNNFSKDSFFQKPNDIINEDNNMDIEMEEKENKKGKGFNSGLEAIKNNSDKKSNKGETGNGIVKNIINNLFVDAECLFYDNLLNSICQKMNISMNDKKNINQIKNEIEENCIIIQENLCFIKEIDDIEIKDVRNLIIREIGNIKNGLKKQQIKHLIEDNGLKISDSKLTKLLQKICKYSGNCWIIKTPNIK